MEKRSHRRIRDLDILTAFQGLVANEIGCARISMMAREHETLLQGAEYRCARPINSRSSNPACTARPVHTQVYGQAERPAVPGLEDVAPQSCRRHRGDGSVRRTDDLISLALWLVNHGAWSTTGFMVWRYRASDRRMDRKSDHASVRLEAGPSLSDPRPPRGLWRSLCSKSSIHGHS